MHKILKLFTVLAVTIAFSPVSRAQTVVDGNTAKFLREFDDKKIKPAHIDTSYWSTSKEIRFAVGLNATSDNWHQSSDMSSLQLNVFSVLGANYKREYTNWQNVLDIRLGFTWKDAGKLAPDARNLSVAENYLRLETQYGVKIVRRFDFAANAKLVTQIMPSYEKENSKDPNKKFMAPGVMDVGVGATYTYSSKRINSLRIGFFPVNNNTTFVLDQRLADLGTSGVRKAEYDDEDNLIRHGANSKVVWGVRTEFYIKYFITESKKIWVDNNFSLFVDYMDNFGAGKMDNKTSLVVPLGKNIQMRYDLYLRYYDSDETIKYKWTTNDAGEQVKEKEIHGATLQTKNYMSLALSFSF